MKDTTISSKIMAKTKQHLSTDSETFAGMDEASKTGLSMMTGVSVIIGTWALASLISALVGISGSPMQLIRHWFSAVTGL